jgi:hypothetical protein
MRGFWLGCAGVMCALVGWDWLTGLLLLFAALSDEG